MQVPKGTDSCILKQCLISFDDKEALHVIGFTLTLFLWWFDGGSASSKISTPHVFKEIGFVSCMCVKVY